jgi:hypothetical protein
MEKYFISQLSSFRNLFIISQKYVIKKRNIFFSNQVSTFLTLDDLLYLSIKHNGCISNINDDEVQFAEVFSRFFFFDCQIHDLILNRTSCFIYIDA